MIRVRFAIAAGIVLAAVGLHGAGFGLYEMDAKTTAMGGHVVGKPFNASTIYYNPAGMSCLTGTCVCVGGTFLNPPIPYSVWGEGQPNESGKIDPGWFAFPTFFISQELPWNFHFGLGFYADFGLGSEYPRGWALKYDTVETLFEGLTLNPAVSWKFPFIESAEWLERLSLAAGLRWTWVNFETTQLRDFNLSRYMGAYYPNYGINKLDLQADNQRHLGLGYNVGLRYDFTEDISGGVMFRSPIKTRVQGDAVWEGEVVGGKKSNYAESDVWLPAQVTLGMNWERAFGVEDLHFGISGSWIEWSKLDQFAFDVYNPVKKTYEQQEIKLKWHDTLRMGFGFGYDVTKNWEALIGYIYDWDPSQDSAGLAHTMLPPGDRHIVSFGIAWHTIDRDWEIALAFAPIIMQHSCAEYKSEYGDRTLHMDTETSVTHCVNVSLVYHFK